MVVLQAAIQRVSHSLLQYVVSIAPAAVEPKRAWHWLAHWA